MKERTYNQSTLNKPAAVVATREPHKRKSDLTQLQKNMFFAKRASYVRTMRSAAYVFIYMQHIYMYVSFL